jgi:hypothetical protein
VVELLPLEPLLVGAPLELLPLELPPLELPLVVGPPLELPPVELAAPPSGADLQKPETHRWGCGQSVSTEQE